MESVMIEEVNEIVLSNSQKEFVKLLPLFKKHITKTGGILDSLASKMQLSVGTIYSYWRGVLPDPARCEFILKEGKRILKELNIEY